MNNSQQRPIARQEGLVIQEMPEEVLVYDLETNKAHCLNETAAFVWKACDGSKSVGEIAKLFGSESGKAVSEDLVWLAIDQLNESNLLAKELKADFRGQSRRDVIKKIGLAAVVALPIVSSLVAPSAALAVACTAGTTTCTNGGANCDPGIVCQCSMSAAMGQCNGGGICTADGTGVTPC